MPSERQRVASQCLQAVIMYFVCTEDLASVQAGCVSFASPYMKDLSGVVPQTKCFLE